MQVRTLGGLAAVATLVWSARSARRQDVSDGEEAVFRWFNDADDQLERAVWAVTQAGSLASVFVTAALVERRHGPREGVALAAVGTGVWGLVKAIKPVIGRGRPHRHLDDVHVRGHPQHGLGYPSGHAAVATSLALLTTTTTPSRAIAGAGAALVGAGRMYLGAHLPLDVVGGAATGAGVAIAVNVRRPAPTSRGCGRHTPIPTR